MASELPRERSTLLVRLMAAGPLLPQAIEDLAALPLEAHERALAEQILLRLQHALSKKASPTPEEQEFIVTMQNTWEKARDEGRREGRDEGRQEGRDQGRLEGRDEGRLAQARAAVRRVLGRRSLVPSVADDAQIDGCTDVGMLERWLDQALTARTVAEALQGAVTGARRRKGGRSS